jgi:hypothetical protein
MYERKAKKLPHPAVSPIQFSIDIDSFNTVLRQSTGEKALHQWLFELVIENLIIDFFLTSYICKQRARSPTKPLEP